MSRIAHYLVRLLRIAAGFLAGIIVAAAIILVLDLNHGRLPDLKAGTVMAGFLAFQAARFLWPILLIQFVAEAMRWRALAFHLGVGLLGSVATLAWTVIQAGQEAPDPILGEEPAVTVTKVVVAAVAGLAGGFVYWLIAGRSAGLQLIERTDR